MHDTNKMRIKPFCCLLSLVFTVHSLDFLVSQLAALQEDENDETAGEGNSPGGVFEQGREADTLNGHMLGIWE